MLVFLAWSVHNGSLPHADVATHITRIRALVAEQTYPAWAQVAKLLEGWPSWLSDDIPFGARGVA